MEVSRFVIAGVLQTALPGLAESFTDLATSKWAEQQPRSTPLVMKRYARNFKQEAQIYQNYITKLLGGIVVDEDDIHRMIKTPRDPLWSNEVLEKQLRARLDDSFDTLLNTISDVKVDVDDLTFQISTEMSQGQVFRSEKFAARYLAMLKENYDETLQKIQDLNNLLTGLVQQSKHSESRREKREASRYARKLKALRQHATNMHECLKSCACQTYSCRFCSTLSLRLAAIQEEKDLFPETFIVGSVPEPTAWHDDDNIDYSEAPLLRLQPRYKDDFLVSDLRQSHRRRLTEDHKKEHVQKSHKVVESRSDDVLISMYEMQLSETSKNETYIANLCTSIFGGCAEDNFLGILGTGRGAWEYVVNLDKGQDTCVADEIVSLQDLLTLHDSSSTSALCHFPFGDRLRAAIILAWGIMFLDGTWMRTPWNSKDIFISLKEIETPEPIRETCQVVFPCLSEVDKYISDDKSADMLMLFQAMGVPGVLFALGISLIELSLGQPISTIQREDEKNKGDVVGKRLTAMRVLPAVQKCSGADYCDVVRRCITCPFDVRDPSLDNEEFLGKVFVHVVRPLMADYRNFNGL